MEVVNRYRGEVEWSSITAGYRWIMSYKSVVHQSESNIQAIGGFVQKKETPYTRKEHMRKEFIHLTFLYLQEFLILSFLEDQTIKVLLRVQKFYF